MSLDWTKIKRRLPFANAGVGGNKKAAPCPHCGSTRYGYHLGRFKSCPACGFDKSHEGVFDHVRGQKKRGLAVEPEMEEWAETYYRRVYLGEKAETTPAE